MLDTQFPRIHGDIANARTWSVPVHYRVVRGATPKQAVYDGGKEILDGFIDAAKELVKMGADGITTNCGFLSLFQEKMDRSSKCTSGYIFFKCKSRWFKAY